MTKYILHGGETGRKTKDNKKFFIEMAKGLLNPVNVLCVYFARDKQVWDEKFSEDKINFSSASPKKVFNFILADENINILKKQIKNADVIYLRGGNVDLLKKVMKRIKNLKNLWNDKLVSGSSAGAYLLSKYYIDSKGNIGMGLGILPIKTFCHYKRKIRQAKTAKGI